MSVHPATPVVTAPLTRSAPPRASALSFGVAGVLLAAYPALRPYSSETGWPGALAFGSDRWVLAHTGAMVAFGCLAAAICGTSANRLVRASVLLGVGLILPYYGAETFGLHAIGRAAVIRGDGSLTGLSDLVRNNPVALTMFGAGLIAVAVAGVALARVLWRDHARVGAVLVGAGLALYLPQFFGPAWARIAHGVILGVGLVIVAVHTARKEAVAQPSTPTTQRPVSR